MMDAGIAMIVTGVGAAGLLWPAGPGVAMACAPICAVLSAYLVAPGAARASSGPGIAALDRRP